jgi:hypothetical protein
MSQERMSKIDMNIHARLNQFSQNGLKRISTRAVL